MWGGTLFFLCCHLKHPIGLPLPMVWGFWISIIGVEELFFGRIIKITVMDILQVLDCEYGFSHECIVIIVIQRIQFVLVYCTYLIFRACEDLHGQFYLMALLYFKQSSVAFILFLLL